MGYTWLEMEKWDAGRSLKVPKHKKMKLQCCTRRL